MKINQFKIRQARLIGAFTTLGFLSACAAATPFVAPVGGASPNPAAAAAATVGAGANVGGTSAAGSGATGAGATGTATTGVGAGANVGVGASAGAGAGISAGVNGNASLGGTTAGVTAGANVNANQNTATTTNTGTTVAATTTTATTVAAGVTATPTPTPTTGATATPTPTPTTGATATPTPTPTTAAGAQAAVPISAALSSFLVLSGTGVMNHHASSIAGDVGVSPTALTANTGFGTLPAADSVTFSNGGSIRSVATAATAQNDLTTAYNDALGRVNVTAILGSTINGNTLLPGLYRTSAAAVVGPMDLTLDASSASDPANAVFIFQIHDALTTAANSHIVLKGGALAKNVYWQIGSSATLGANSVMKGNLIALTAITIGANVALQGRALARNAAVTMDTDIITAP